MRPSVEEIKATFRLEPHPTCGLVRESYRSERCVPASALPGFDGDRAEASVLYFLVTPDAQMALHRIRPTQMYHHYLGDALEVLLLYPDGSGGVQTVGPPSASMEPQLLIPGSTWHVSRLREGGEYALLATTEWPGVEPADVEVADVDELASSYRALEREVRDFGGHQPARPLRHP